MKQAIRGCVPALLAVWAVTAMSALAGQVAHAGAQAATGPPVAGAPIGDAAHGKAIYRTYGCYSCHGLGGQGGVTGTRLTQNPITFAAFGRELRHPRDQMPPYTVKVVSEKELADLYAFVRSFPPPPAADSIPLLKRNK
jgi:mono/diheme cytochrome c family protein